MSREQFLQTRIAALSDSIRRHGDMIQLYETVPDTDANQQRRDIAEFERRLKIDQTLLDARQKELRDLAR